MDDDLTIQEVALSIYGCFSMEPDPARVVTRFNRLRPLIRDRFLCEARAAIEKYERLRGEDADYSIAGRKR